MAHSTQSKWFIGGTACVMLLIAAIYFSNRGYGEVSGKTYDYAKALYSICNRRAKSGLDAIEPMIEQSLHAGEISETESRWLGGIITSARDGDWESAAKDSRRILADQVR